MVSALTTIAVVILGLIDQPTISWLKKLSTTASYNQASSNWAWMASDQLQQLRIRQALGKAAQRVSRSGNR